MLCGLNQQKPGTAATIEYLQTPQQSVPEPDLTVGSIGIGLLGVGWLLQQKAT